MEEWAMVSRSALSWALGIATLPAVALRSVVVAASSVRAAASAAPVQSSSAWRRAAAMASLVSRRIRLPVRASIWRSAVRGGTAARRAASSSSTLAAIAL